jgi:PIN domain nuclease of toxin-antitoxin system
MKLLLDTCTVLWIASDPARLSKAAREAYEDPGNERYLSAASVWEMAIKHGAGKLPLPGPLAGYVSRFREGTAAQALAIDEESAVHTLSLPRMHGDPFDRILVAQAIVHGLTILTCDPLIRQYPARTFW